MLLAGSQASTTSCLRGLQSARAQKRRPWTRHVHRFPGPPESAVLPSSLILSKCLFSSASWVVGGAHLVSRLFVNPSRQHHVSRILFFFLTAVTSESPGQKTFLSLHACSISRSSLSWSPLPVLGLLTVVDALTPDTRDRSFCS